MQSELDKPIVKKQPRGKANEYYVNPEEFKEELIAFYAMPDGSIPCDGLGIKIQKIASKLSFMPRFKGYSFRKDMVSRATEKMLKALLRKNFDPDRGYNPFSYFTSIAYNEFRAAIKEEKKRFSRQREFMDASRATMEEFGNGFENVRRDVDDSFELWDESLNTLDPNEPTIEEIARQRDAQKKLKAQAARKAAKSVQDS